MKCNYCRKETNTLVHSFHYGFACWKCICRMNGKKICLECGKPTKTFRKNRCLKCYRHLTNKSLKYKKLAIHRKRLIFLNDRKEQRKKLNAIKKEYSEMKI